MSESDNSEAEIHEPAAFGQQLMLAREKAGMTIEETARALNLRIEMVEAIEESDLEKLPPLTFVQGYIRSYARLLDLSEEKIISEFEEEVPHKIESELHPRPGLPDEADSQTPVIKLISALIIVIAVFVLTYAVYSYYSEKSERMGKASQAEQDDASMQLPPEAPIIEQHARITDDDSLIVEAPPSPAEDEETRVESAEITEELQQPEVEPDAAEAAEATEVTEAETVEVAEVAVSEVPVIEGEVSGEESMAVPTTVPITGGDVLVVSAEQESWAEIVDANDIRLFYGTIQPGREIKLTGQTPFDVFLGNAPVVSLSLNANNIDMTKYIRSNNIAHFKISVEDGRVRFH